MKSEKKSLRWVVVMSLIILAVATIVVTGAMVVAGEKVITGIIFGSIIGGLLATWVVQLWRLGCYDCRPAKKPTFRVVDCYEQLGFGCWDLICQGREEGTGFLTLDNYAILRNRETGEKVVWFAFHEIPARGVKIEPRDTWEVIPLEGNFDLVGGESLNRR